MPSPIAAMKMSLRLSNVAHLLRSRATSRATATAFAMAMGFAAATGTEGVAAPIRANPPSTTRPVEASPEGRMDWMPARIDLVIEAHDLARWWHRPAARGLTSLLEHRLADSEVGTLWRNLSDLSGLDGKDLAERLLGGELVLGLPLESHGEPIWIASMRVDEASRRDLLSRLPLRPLGRGRHELRGHDVVILDRPPHLFAGPPGVIAGLPEDVPPRASGASAPICSIELRRGLSIAPIRVAAWIDGNVIRLEGVQQRPGSATSSRLVVDPPLREVLDRLRGHHAAVVATVAGGPSPIGAEWFAVLPELAVPPSLGRCAKARRIWTVGETCGGARDRMRPHPTPAAAAAFEVSDGDEGRRRLDAWAAGLAMAIDRRFAGVVAERDAPRIEVLRTIDGGTIPLASMARTLFEGHAIAERIRLDWSSASGPSGDWAIVGTGGAYLRDVRDAFEPIMPPAPSVDATAAGEPGSDDSPTDWRLVQMGWIDGDRVSGHLGHWCDRGFEIFDAERTRSWRSRLEGMLEATSTIRDMEWSIEEDASGRRRFEIRLEPAIDP